MASQHHTRTPKTEHQGQEEKPAEHFKAKITRDSVRKRKESARISGAVLKVQCTGAISRACTWGYDRGMMTQGTQESQREDLGGVSLWRDLEGQPLRSLS